MTVALLWKAILFARASHDFQIGVHDLTVPHLRIEQQLEFVAVPFLGTAEEFVHTQPIVWLSIRKKPSSYVDNDLATASVQWLNCCKARRRVLPDVVEIFNIYGRPHHASKEMQSPD